jgi:hypothetical protein
MGQEMKSQGVAADKLQLLSGIQQQQQQQQPSLLVPSKLG